MHNALISEKLRELHGALLEIVAMMNGAERDEMLIREAGIQLDRAQFPLLVAVDRFGPIGVGDLADRVGRDYTTVSRQLATMEERCLIVRGTNSRDRRIREARIAPAGSVMARAIDIARDRVLRQAFADWAADDLDDLVTLTCRLAEAMRRGQHEVRSD
ncbi:MarR family winged helix-turn-helix transcriptional regulator [Novosphingobium sp. 9]|uniref:MarR family winged helix-turn-helix transcriptional regulator n=1 Tax=Novosphingobium sp. 9 TaxID=2025349 RepID=UPI0021B5045F|nr:MarR family transcriptional regulator [Novosphingobium sp. 9]